MRGENRLPASTGGAEVTGTCGKNRIMNLGARGRESGSGNLEGKTGIKRRRRKKLSRGASLRGQGAPAYPARLRSERARNSSENKLFKIQKKTLQKSLQNLAKFNGFLSAKFSGASHREAGNFPALQISFLQQNYFSSSPRRNS